MYFYVGQFGKAKEEFKSPNRESSYNIALCSLMLHSYAEAFIELHKCVVYTEGKDRGKILLLMGILQLALDSTEEAKELITEAYRHDPDTVNEYLDDKADLKILPLQSTSKLASIFPMAKVRVGRSKGVLIRPSFALPKVDLPELSVTEDITRFFDLLKVKCKPEPPWLNRVRGTIQFTEQIYEVTHESEGSDAEDVQASGVKEETKKSRKKCKSANDLPDCKMAVHKEISSDESSDEF